MWTPDSYSTEARTLPRAVNGSAACRPPPRPLHDSASVASCPLTYDPSYVLEPANLVHLLLLSSVLFLSAQNSFGFLKHRLKHRFGQFPSEGVLLTRMIGTEEREIL